MSGPKYSRAYIRDLQRLQQLAKELEAQIETAKKLQIISEITALEGEVQACCSDKIEDYKKIVKEVGGLVPDSIILSKMIEIIESIDGIRCAEANTDGNSDELSKKRDKRKEDIQKIKSSLKVLVELKKQLSVEVTNAAQEKTYKEFMAMDWADTEEKIDVIPSDISDLYFEVIEMIAGREDYDEIKQSIDEGIMKTGDNSFKKKQLEMRKKAIIVEKNSSNNVVILSAKMSELKSLYTLLGWEEKELPNELEEIDNEIKNAYTILEQRQASKYIASCVHQVFKDLGYDLLDDSIMHSTAGETNKVVYDYGEDSMVNVSISDKGQMLFEVVGDGTDREMDEKRATQLEAEMRRFCPNYADIRTVLREQFGISLEDEHLCEPNKKYAKAIDVNTKKQNRRSNKEKKMMHYDD